MKHIINIQVDTNDCDYIEQTLEINEEALEEIMPMIEAIKNFQPYKKVIDKWEWSHEHNFPVGEIVRHDLGELTAEEYYVTKKEIPQSVFDAFMDLCPYSDFGFHTIVSIKLFKTHKILL